MRKERAFENKDRRVFRMIVQSLIGRAGAGKTYRCLEDIRARLLDDPTGTPLIYLVPEQMTFQIEYALITSAGLQGTIRAQVFSFTRLAWKVLQEVGGLSRQHIDNVGIHMLLRKITERQRQHFQLFGRASEQNGFLDQIEELLIEMKRHCIKPEALLQLNDHYQQLEGTQKAQQLQLVHKLQDVHRMYADFEAELQSKYVDSEDYLRMLADKMGDSQYIQSAEIWIDGFHSFTPQEFQVIEALMKQAKKLTVTHTLDRPYDQQLPHELDIFHSSAKTYQRIQKLAKEIGAEILPTEIMKHKNDLRDSSLRYLEANYYKRPIKAYEGASALVVATAVNRRAEVEGLARAIIAKVRDDGYQYRDLAIVLRNIEDYQELLETIFLDYNIPVFIDQKKPMLYHPIVELIRSSLDVVNHNWNYEAVFRCVKTDLLVYRGDNEVDERQQNREALDRLENYVLSKGIQGRRWTDHHTWKASNEIMETEINLWRERVARPLQQLEMQLTTCNTATEMCEAIYLFLVLLKVPETISQWQSEAEILGDVELAKRHQQAWQAVMNLLDQMVELMGEEAIPLELFTKIIESGLQTLQFSLVPPALDQVVVANIDHSRLMNVQCMYFIGVNEGVIPKKMSDTGILTEDEREWMQRSGLELAPSLNSRLMEEPFIIYNTLSTALQHLWVSYPLADEEGKSLLPANLIGQLKDMFPKASKPLLVDNPYDEAPDKQDAYITHPTRTISFVTNQIRQWKRGYSIEPMWWDAYNWYVGKDLPKPVKVKWRRAIGSLFYKNQEFRLQRKTSEALYGSSIQGSVSRMENYRGCPFSQFANYGLKLKERELYRLENPDIGQLYHGSLKLIAEELRSLGKHWGDVTETEYQQLAEDKVQSIAKESHEVLLSSKRHQYILRRLTDVIKRTTVILGKQAKASGFTPIALELGFGLEDGLPALKLVTSNGTTINLRGRIDRIDEAIINDERLLRIIDYKSSQQGFDLSEVADGLSLQMLTYLDVVLTFAEELLGQGQQAVPAGALYFHVHNPIIHSKQALSPAKIDQDVMKRYQLKGFVLAEQDIAEAMDIALAGEGSRRSDIIPVSIKKDGEFGATSPVITRNEFTQLRKHMRDVITDIGQQMFEGIIDIKPYRLKEKTPCTYCNYRALCQFDSSLAENQYRRIPRVKNIQELFSKLGGDTKDADKSSQ